MKLPEYFKPILWSYDFTRLDTEKNKRLIITNAINYGDLEHWKWISDHYGKDEVRNVLTELPVHQLREKVRPLAAIFFNVEQYNHAPRSVN